jgi:hypothetical protein
MSERKNTRDLVHFYMEEFKEKFKEYQIKEISDCTLAISADGKEWNVITFGFTWCVDRNTKLGFVPKYNPDTCYEHKVYLESLKMREKRTKALERYRIRKQKIKEEN